MPFLSIFFLNVRIMWDLRHVKVSHCCGSCGTGINFQAQRFGSKKKLNKEINLFVILLRY